MSEQSFDRRMLEALVCPETRAQLTYDAEAQEFWRFIQGEVAGEKLATAKP